MKAEIKKKTERRKEGRQKERGKEGGDFGIRKQTWEVCKYYLTKPLTMGST